MATMSIDRQWIMANVRRPPRSGGGLVSAARLKGGCPGTSVVALKRASVFSLRGDAYFAPATGDRPDCVAVRCRIALLISFCTSPWSWLAFSNTPFAALRPLAVKSLDRAV
jgi:hypothetical protein